MNVLCECEQAGYCPRHQMEKDERLWQCCRGECDSLDCGQKYWRAWEQGFLGATAPAAPQPDIDWECMHQILGRPQPGSRLLRPRRSQRLGCRVGQRVKDLIKLRCGAVPKGGCKCDENAKEMDAWGCDGCEARFDECVEMLIEGAESIWYVKPVVWLLGEDACREEAAELLREAIRLERASVDKELNRGK